MAVVEAEGQNQHNSNQPGFGLPAFSSTHSASCVVQKALRTLSSDSSMIADWTINPKNERIALATCRFAICRNAATFCHLITADERTDNRWLYAARQSTVPGCQLMSHERGCGVAFRDCIHCQYC